MLRLTPQAVLRPAVPQRSPTWAARSALTASEPRVSLSSAEASRGRSRRSLDTAVNSHQQPDYYGVQSPHPRAVVAAVPRKLITVSTMGLIPAEQVIYYPRFFMGLSKKGGV